MRSKESETGNREETKVNGNQDKRYKSPRVRIEKRQRGAEGKKKEILRENIEKQPEKRQGERLKEGRDRYTTRSKKIQKK